MHNRAARIAAARRGVRIAVPAPALAWSVALGPAQTAAPIAVRKRIAVPIDMTAVRKHMVLDRNVGRAAIACRAITAAANT